MKIKPRDTKKIRIIISQKLYNRSATTQKPPNALTLYEKIQKTTLYKLGRRSVLVNSLRVSVVLLLIVASFFCFVAPRESAVSLEATWEKIDSIVAQRISDFSFESRTINFSRFDAIVLSPMKNYKVIYDDTEYDNSYAIVIRPFEFGNCEVWRDGAEDISGWQQHSWNSHLPILHLPNPTSIQDKAEISGNLAYQEMAYDTAIPIYYDLRVSYNMWGTNFQFEHNEQYYFGGKFSIEIYKDNELVLNEKEDEYHIIKIPMMRGVNVSTYGEGVMYLSKVASCDMQLYKPTKIQFTGSGKLQYYYLSEGKTDSIDNYDTELVSKDGFNKCSLIQYDALHNKILISGNAENVKYFGRSLFPSVWEWLRANVWALPVSLITIIGTGVSLTKKD